jgi:hypothetical protein
MSRRIRAGEWGVLLSSRFMSIKKDEREVLINNISNLTPELFGYHDKEIEHCKTIIRNQCKSSDEGSQDWENYIGNFYTWGKLSYKTNKDLQILFNQFVRNSDLKEDFKNISHTDDSGLTNRPELAPNYLEKNQEIKNNRKEINEKSEKESDQSTDERETRNK